MSGVMRVTGAVPRLGSKGARFGLTGYAPPEPPRPISNTSSEFEHPEDSYLFGEGHEPIPVRQTDDKLGSMPPVPPEVSESIITKLADLEVGPGIQDSKSLFQRLADRIKDDSKISNETEALKRDCQAVFDRAEQLHPVPPKLKDEITMLRMELINTLAHVDKWKTKDRFTHLLHRHSILKRIIRCRESYERITKECSAAQSDETLNLVREQNRPRIAELEGEIQADEEELQRILRRETGRNIPREIILQRQIRWRGNESYCNPIRFSVFKGQLMSGEDVAIKYFEKTQDLHNDDGKHFGRRTLRHASTWTSFDSKYILPFLGMGVQVLKRGAVGRRDVYKVFFVSPWLPDGDAINYIRKTHAQNLYVDIAKIVRDVALGLQYLHEREEPWIHGSLRGENVLIKRENEIEQACLNGFALTKACAKPRNEDIELTGEDNVHRWRAPELVDARAGFRMEPSSDIWSWAMTALQLYSGLEPYHQLVRNHEICGHITTGKIPNRAGYPDFEKYAPQPDATWSLFQKCWNMEPSDRPTIQEVINELDRINAAT